MTLKYLLCVTQTKQMTDLIALLWKGSQQGEYPEVEIVLHPRTHWKEDLGKH